MNEVRHVRKVINGIEDVYTVFNDVFYRCKSELPNGDEIWTQFATDDGVNFYEFDVVMTDIEDSVSMFDVEKAFNELHEGFKCFENL